jgi:hypothetical protein
MDKIEEILINDVPISVKEKEPKLFCDANDTQEEEFFGAIEIQNNESQLYHPLVHHFKEEQSRLVKCLSISPQYQQIQEPVDEKSVRRTLRPSKSADFNSRVHLDTNDESRVSLAQVKGELYK